MPAPSGFDHVSTTRSNSTRSIAAHPCKKRKDGAPSAGMVHAKFVKGGPAPRVRPCRAAYSGNMPQCGDRRFSRATKQKIADHQQAHPFDAQRPYPCVCGKTVLVGRDGRPEPHNTPRLLIKGSNDKRDWGKYSPRPKPSRKKKGRKR
jgi:hypothetical protein